jgi:LPXTG-site transpeptidase (sortase) family protein
MAHEYLTALPVRATSNFRGGWRHRPPAHFVFTRILNRLAPAINLNRLSQATTNAFFGHVPLGAALQSMALAAVAVAGARAEGLPVRLIIPALGVDANVQANGLSPDGSIGSPSTIFDAGWFTGSSRPGEKGSSVVTGHVAQIRRSKVTKQGVFYNLSMLRPGDTLYVVKDTGETTTFVVRDSRAYAPGAGTSDIFTAQDDGAHMNLITCEGVWNQSTLSFSQRLVVFTDAVS